jgi:hypothetical protein
LPRPLRQMSAKVCGKDFSGARPERHHYVLEQRMDIIKPKEWQNIVAFLTTNNFSACGARL